MVPSRIANLRQQLVPATPNSHWPRPLAPCIYKDKAPGRHCCQSIATCPSTITTLSSCRLDPCSIGLAFFLFIFLALTRATRWLPTQVVTHASTNRPFLPGLEFEHLNQASSRPFTPIRAPSSTFLSSRARRLTASQQPARDLRHKQGGHCARPLFCFCLL